MFKSQAWISTFDVVQRWSLIQNVIKHADYTTSFGNVELRSVMFIIEISIKHNAGSDFQIIIWRILRNHANCFQDDVSVRQMTSKNTISLCWRTMPLRGLGPKGARVGHSVCIVRQVLSKGQTYICCYAHQQKYGCMFFILDHSPSGHPFSLI